MNSGPASTRARARLWGGLALSMTGLAAIAWLTLRPNPASLVVGPAPCCAATDLLFNVLLYLPLGAGLALLGIRPGSAVAAGGLLSAGIELAQRAWVPGRFASPYDVATNLAGCALGVLIVASWDRRAAWWPFLAPPLAVTVVLGWFLGGYLAQPAIPGPAPWRAEWAPESPGVAAFRGQILDVRLQGTPIGAGPVANLSVLRARLAASRKVDFSATLVTGVASAKRSRLLEVVVGEGTVPFLVLDQEGGTLLAYQRTGLSWVGLRGPWLELEDALPLAAGDTVRVQLEATRRHLRLVADHAGAERESVLRLSPELYFSALFYRATDGTFWWGLVPAMLSFLLLGLALANRPKLLAVACLAALFLSAYGGGSAFPAWPVTLSTLASAAAGRALANRFGMFRG
jgi:VanZ family protein